MSILRRFLPFFRPHYGRGIWLAVLLIISSGLTVVTPFFYKELVDIGIFQQEPTTIILMVILIAGSLVVQELLFLAQTTISLRMRESVFMEMKEAVYIRLMSLSPGYFAEQHKGRLLSRLLSDVSAIQYLFLDRLVFF